MRVKGANERMKLRDAEAILKVGRIMEEQRKRNEKERRRRYRKKEYCHLRR